MRIPDTVRNWITPPKTYEKPPNSAVALGALKTDAFASLIESLEKHAKYFDISVLFGKQQYTLHHAIEPLRGWNVEIRGKEGDGLETVLAAVMSTVGASKDDGQPTSDGKVMVAVETKDGTNFGRIIGSIDQYLNKIEKGSLSITGYGFSRLNYKMYKDLDKAGIPLQVAQPKE